MATRKKTTSKAGSTFVPQVLRVEGAIGKRIHKALSGDEPVQSILALLKNQVDPQRCPAWVAYNAGDVLDRVVHLEAPVFGAVGADEDEFFNEPGSPQLVALKKGKGTRVTKSGDCSNVKLSTKDLPNVTAFDGGGFLLAELTWTDAPPASLPAFEKLLTQAVDAYTGELPAYESPAAEAEVSSAEVKVSSGAPAETSLFLGGLDRTGFTDVAVPRTKPKIAWTSNSEDNGGSEWGGNPVVSDGVIFAGETSFNARCSATSLEGKSLWRTELSKTQSWLIGSACVSGGVVYQATNQGLHALDAKTGEVRWLARLSAVAGSPLVLGDLVFIGTGEGLVGLALANGRRKWTFEVNRDEYKQGVVGGVAARDGVLFFVAEQKLFAVEAATRTKRWTAPAHGKAPPSVDDANVYTWSPAGLVAIDGATGKERWHHKFADLNWTQTVAVAADRVVVRAAGKLTALDKATGAVLWTFATAAPYQMGCASPCIAKDVVLCVLVNQNTDDLAFHGVDLTTGKALWSVDHFPLRQTEKAALSWYCTPCVHDGTIYVQAYGIHALRS